VKVIVTGGAGFIGSHIVDRLCELDIEVVVIDSLDPAAHDGPPDWLNPAARYVWRDVADPDVWEEVEGADAICHQAAKVGLGVDPADIGAYVRSNDVGTATMLQACHLRRWSGRLVLASSMVVYGEGRYRCAEHGVVAPTARDVVDLQAGRFEPRCPSCGEGLTSELVPEDAPTDPRNVYAATKLHQEHLCAAWARYAAAPVCFLRYHNVYGPRMPRDTPYAGVASIFRSQLSAGTAPRVFEDGAQRRDFVHVDDVARANIVALTDASHAEGAFNVASGHPVTLLEMARMLAGADGRGIEPVVTGEFRLGDVRHVVADPRRARRELGLVDTVEPTAGIPRFAEDPLRRPPAARR
jgi:dTDP-L-rhamnose 4-epimerase